MTAARRTSEIAAGILPVALVIALWHGIALSGIAPPVLLPAPGAVFARLIAQAGDRQFLDHAGITLYRLFAGFSIAAVAGITLGLAATGAGRWKAWSSRWCACSRRCPRSRSIRR